MGTFTYFVSTLIAPKGVVHRNHLDNYLEALRADEGVYIHRIGRRIYFGLHEGSPVKLYKDDSFSGERFIAGESKCWNWQACEEERIQDIMRILIHLGSNFGVRGRVVVQEEFGTWETYISLDVAKDPSPHLRLERRTIDIPD